MCCYINRISGKELKIKKKRQLQDGEPVTEMASTAASDFFGATAAAERKEKRLEVRHCNPDNRLTLFQFAHAYEFLA